MDKDVYIQILDKSTEKAIGNIIDNYYAGIASGVKTREEMITALWAGFNQIHDGHSIIKKIIEEKI